MSDIPSGWRLAALGDVCLVVSGATPKTGVPEYWGGQVPWLTPKDLSRDRSQTLSKGERSLTRTGYECCSAQTFPAGSVIVSSRAPVGYVTIAGVEMCTNQGCKTAVPPPYIDSKYLYWYLINAKPDLESRASGTTFKEISSKRFAETCLRWPDLEAQRRIVEILEDHLSRLDAAAQGLSSALGRTKASEVSFLREVAHGPLVPLGELAVESRYGTSAKCKVGGPGMPVVRIPNLADGRIDLTEEKRAMDASIDLSALMLAPGDLLVVRTNGSRDLIGRAAVVQPGVDAAFASYLIRFKFDERRVRPEWVRLVMESPDTRRLLEGLAASSAGQYNLGLKKLHTVPIPCPELAIQQDTLSRADHFQSSLAELRRSIRRAERHGQALRRSLLDAAFSGTLTSPPSGVRARSRSSA